MPDAAQLALDALVAPVVEGAAILDEALGEARVVEVAQLDQLGDRLLDRVGLYALGLEMPPHLEHRAITEPEVAVAQVQRVLEADLRIDGTFGGGHRDSA